VLAVELDMNSISRLLKMLGLVLWVSQGTACVGPQTAPTLPFLNATLFHDDISADMVKPGNEMALGQELHVFGSWNGTCKDNWFVRSFESKPSELTCNGKRFTLRVRCQTPCQVYPYLRPNQRTDYGVNDSQTLVVIPLQTGPFTFVATLDTGTAEPAPLYSATILVQEPERVTLLCKYPSKPNEYAGKKGQPCDQRAISATAPWVLPAATFHGVEYSPKVVTINGRAGFPEKKQHLQFTFSEPSGVVSLADVVSAGPVPAPTPNQEEVNTIAPGAYTVVVTVGATAATYQLNVE
jgi:hypothetical protein